LQKWRITALAGLVLVVAGVVLALQTEQESTRFIKISDETLDEPRVIPVGRVEKDQRVKLTYYTEANVLVSFMRSDTKEMIPISPDTETTSYLVYNGTQIGYLGALIEVTSGGEYEFLFDPHAFLTQPSEPVKVISIHIEVGGAEKNPYLYPGAGLAAVGALLLVVSLQLKRRS